MHHQHSRAYPPQGRATDWVRVSRLQTCLCQFLCGVEPPVLRLQKTDGGEVLVPALDATPPPSPPPEQRVGWRLMRNIVLD